MSAKPKLSPVRLQCPSEFFGRADELAQLDAAWASEGHTRVVTIIAWGGVGKTALAAWWRSRLLAARSDVEAVFEWSFYSQGTQDRNAATAERFIHEALIFFDERELAESPAGQRVKATRLVEVIRARRVVLILDGLEPLQHPPDGAGLGALKEEGLAVLLQGLARQNPGLCVVTSRERVRELEGFEKHGASCIDLDRLDASAGSQLLRSVLEGEMRAVKPVRSSEAERGEIVTAMQGHALSLLLVGSYVRRALGDVRRWREIDLREADLATQRGRVWRVMEKYSTWLAGEVSGRRSWRERVRGWWGGPKPSEGQMQLAVLRMLGLFDRPADPGCVAALLKKPAIPGLTDGLVGLERERFRLVLTGLQEARLLELAAYQAMEVVGYSEAVARAAGEDDLPEGEPERWPMPDYGSYAVVLEAHPLVREYFGDELRRTNEAAWREGHRRLYEHLCESVPYWPEGIEGLQPLFQAIVHGCAAGRVQESCVAVYRDRIHRGVRVYGIHQLGAFGAELGALANFFEHVWDRPARELSAGDRGWLLNDAAFALRGLGRLSEALEPMRAGLDTYVELGHWKNAAIVAGNLSELELTLGRVAAAVADASIAVTHADRSGDEFMRMASRTILADARLAAGELEQARALFEQAELMQAQRDPSTPELASLGGHWFCDLLLLPAERAAWRASMQHEPPEPALVSLCETVSARATRALAIVVRSRVPLSIALDQLTLGRAALYAARLDAAPSLARAGEHLDAAVAVLRKAGSQDHVPKGLLTRAWLHHLEGHPDLAHADLDEAWSIAERGPMPLFQADIHLHRARLFQNRKALAAAAELIHKHGYGRRLPELEDAQLAAATWLTPTPIPTPNPPMPNPPFDPAQRPDIAILVALPEEFRTIASEYAQHWHPQPNPRHPGSDFLFVGPGGYRCVATIMPRMGPTVASETSMRLLAWRPAVILNVGIAGGFKDELRIGDVIVPRQVDAYVEVGKIKGTQWEPRGVSYRPSATLLADVQQLEFTHPNAHAAWARAGAEQFATLRAGEAASSITDLLARKLLREAPTLSTSHLASGNFVVASKPFAEYLRSINADIHAGEMEAAGMMAAAEYQRERVETLVVRGISDHVDADKGQLDAIGEGGLRRLAMANAWRLVTTLMAEQRLPRAEGAGAPSASASGAGAGTGSATKSANPNEAVLKAWREKLAFLRAKEPMTTDVDAQFRLSKLIEETIAKIREYGGEP